MDACSASRKTHYAAKLNDSTRLNACPQTRLKQHFFERQEFFMEKSTETPYFPATYLPFALLIFGIFHNTGITFDYYLGNQMKIRALSIAILSIATVLAAGSISAADWTAYKDQVRIKKAIADTLTPAQYEARVEMLARALAARDASPRPAAPTVPNLSADTCPATTFDIGTLPYSNASTTVGLVDDYDLPADTTAPTCTAPVTCTGTGVAGSLPQGSIYTGTGMGPDRAYRIQTNAACALTLSMTSTPDLALMLYPTTCSSSLADCGCVSDAGVAGGTETITMTTVANTPYFVVIDGYSAGATPPGPSGAFTFNVTSSTPGCALTPVELQNFSID